MELEFNASDSKMGRKDSDELRSDLASNSSRDLIHPRKKLDNNFHVSFAFTVLRRELHTWIY